jgi:hypothetical protein
MKYQILDLPRKNFIFRFALHVEAGFQTQILCAQRLSSDAVWQAYSASREALRADLHPAVSTSGKNAIHAAKRKFSKKKYLKNSFHYYSFIARFKYCLHTQRRGSNGLSAGNFTSKRQRHDYRRKLYRRQNYPQRQQ